MPDARPEARSVCMAAHIWALEEAQPCCCMQALLAHCGLCSGLGVSPKLTALWAAAAPSHLSPAQLRVQPHCIPTLLAQQG